MTVITAMHDFLAQAKERIEDAPDSARLTLSHQHDQGVLKGYFLGGAVSRVEYQAACGDLRLAYESRKGMFELQREWRRRHGDHATAEDPA